MTQEYLEDMYEFFAEEWQDEYGTYGRVPEIDSEDYLTWLRHQK